MTKIKVYGTDWCHSTFGIREYLMNARLDYDFFDIDRDPAADEFVRALGKGARRYPVIVFPDEIVTNPTVTELGELLRALRVASKNRLMLMRDREHKRFTTVAEQSQTGD